MTLDTVAGAQIRWYERSVIRHYTAKLIPASDETVQTPRDDDSIQISYQLGVQYPDDENDVTEVAVIIRLGLIGELERADVKLRMGVKFAFDSDVQVYTPEPGRAFAHEHGLEYAIGFLRSGMYDACRSVGLRGALLPLMPMSEVTDSLADPEFTFE